jgi:hypothetical protein
MLLAAAAPSVARAADAPAVREAQARFEEGLKRVKAGDFDAARMSFVQAYAVVHKPDILWNLALCEEKSGRPLDALAHFKTFAQEAATAADRVKAQKHVDTLMAQTGHVEVQAPTGTPIVLDGASSVGTTPLSDALDVAPGHHVIEGKFLDGKKTLSVEAVAGEVAHANFMVAGADAPAPAPPPMSSSVDSTPLPAVATQAGSAPAASAPEAEDTAPRSSAGKLATTTALSAGAVIAVGLGVYFGLQSRSDAETAAAFQNMPGSRSRCVNPAASGCAQWNADVQGQNRDATASNVLYVTGGLLAAGAVASWLFWPKSRKGAGGALWVVPSAGPEGGGVLAGGRF